MPRHMHSTSVSTLDTGIIIYPTTYACTINKLPMIDISKGELGF